MQELVRPPAAAQPGLVHVKVQAMRFTAAAAVRPPDTAQPTHVRMLMHIKYHLPILVLRYLQNPQAFQAPRLNLTV